MKNQVNSKEKEIAIIGPTGELGINLASRLAFDDSTDEFHNKLNLLIRGENPQKRYDNMMQNPEIPLHLKKQNPNINNGDLNNPSQLLETIQKIGNKIDIIINSAAIIDFNSDEINKVEDIEKNEKIKTMIQTNTISPILLSKTTNNENILYLHIGTAFSSNNKTEEIDSNPQISIILNDIADLLESLNKKNSNIIIEKLKNNVYELIVKLKNNYYFRNNYELTKFAGKLVIKYLNHKNTKIKSPAIVIPSPYPSKVLLENSINGNTGLNSAILSIMKLSRRIKGKSIEAMITGNSEAVLHLSDMSYTVESIINTANQMINNLPIKNDNEEICNGIVSIKQLENMLKEITGVTVKDINHPAEDGWGRIIQRSLGKSFVPYGNLQEEIEIDQENKIDNKTITNIYRRYYNQ